MADVKYKDPQSNFAPIEENCGSEQDRANVIAAFERSNPSPEGSK